MGKYAMRYRALEARSRDGKIMTKAGAEHWVAWTDESGGWITSTRQDWADGPPDDLMTWSSYAKAVAFAEKWEGHPWYAMVDDYEIVTVTKKMVEVHQGYSLTSKESPNA